MLQPPTGDITDREASRTGDKALLLTLDASHSPATQALLRRTPTFHGRRRLLKLTCTFWRSGCRRSCGIHRPLSLYSQSALLCRVFFGKPMPIGELFSILVMIMDTPAGKMKRHAPLGCQPNVAECVAKTRHEGLMGGIFGL